MDLEGMIAAAVGGSPVALVLAALCKVVWGKYQEALADREELHGLIRDRDQSELEAWRNLGSSKLGESSDE